MRAIAFPVALMLMVYVTYNYVSIKEMGLGGYFSSMIPKGVPVFILVILAPVEILQYLIVRPFTLAVRLFANMFAGHILIAVFTIATWYLFQAGIGNGSRALPPDGAFTSQLDGASVFQFTYGATNALVLGNTYPASGTITLATPRAYNTITFLACSANAAGTLGTLVINFTNGTHSQVFNFNAQDWFNNTSDVAIQGFGRLKLGASFNPEDNGPANPNLYQTTIHLAAPGLNQPIASITFTKPSGAGVSQTTGIFAISGTVIPPGPAMAIQPQSVTKSGTNLMFTVTNGVPGGGWTLLSATNLTVPVNWRANRTGAFDGLGKAILTNGTLSTEPRRFFTIRAP